MLFEEAFFSQLAENAEVTAIVGDRIFPVEIPQFQEGVQTYPAVVYQLIARSRVYVLEGPTNTAESTISVSCLAVDYIQAKRLANAVRHANANVRSTDPLAAVCVDRLSTEIQNEIDSYEFDELEQASLFHVQQTYLIRHIEE